MAGKFYSTKTYGNDRGLSCAFRQWRSTHSHCSLIHGYSIGLKIVFECKSLDERNWVMDFGFAKRAKTTILGMSPKEYFAWLLDHTTIVAEDDPYLPQFEQMDKDGIIQLRILPATGCERFAEFLFEIINAFLEEETNGRVKAAKVEVYEHERNSASYGE